MITSRHAARYRALTHSLSLSLSPSLSLLHTLFLTRSFNNSFYLIYLPLAVSIDLSFPLFIYLDVNLSFFFIFECVLFIILICFTHARWFLSIREITRHCNFLYIVNWIELPSVIWHVIYYIFDVCITILSRFILLLEILSKWILIIRDII